MTDTTRLGRPTNGSRIAKGLPEPGRGCPRIVIAFPEATFALVQQMALEQGMSFSQTARTLIEWGLENAERA